MAELALVNMANIPKDKVGIGSTIRVFDSSKWGSGVQAGHQRRI